MSDRNRALTRNLLAAGLPLAVNFIQETIEAKAAEDRQLAERRTRIMRNRLKIRRENLANRIIATMDNYGSTPNLEALLTQVLSSSDEEIPKYEQVFEEVYSPQRNVTGQFAFIPMAMPPLPMVTNPVPLPNFVEVLNSLAMHNNMMHTNTHNILHNNMIVRRPQEVKIQIQPPRPQIREEEKKICISYEDLQRLPSESACAICLEKYKSGDQIELRHCAHTFHKSCLTAWEGSGRTNGQLCPCCRS
jgi:hypothetical protein